MACTDRHDRYLLRLITGRALLYTEMVTTGAILFGERDRFLAHHPDEHPIALQVGGNKPMDLARCAAIAGDYGYDEVNMNVGCPSDRVQSGCFGAALMANPDLVAECVDAMRAATALPVTVKTRIGIDHHDSYEALCEFVATVANAGCERFIIHARKAWLSGLSPKENREIPPLRYDVVARLQNDYPRLGFVLNGGIETIGDAQQHLLQFPGVMMGRTAYHNPFLLIDVDHEIYGEVRAPRSRDQILNGYCDYTEQACAKGVPLRLLARHVLGLFHGTPGARIWRRYISEHLHSYATRQRGPELFRDARAIALARSATNAVLASA